LCFDFSTTDACTVAGGSLPESCPKNGDLTEVSASINWQRWCHRLAQF
jgi:hypothetical protein